MKVEVLIYIYLVICLAMIIFNTVCIFVFRSSDKRLRRKSEGLEEEIMRQIEFMDRNGLLTEDHTTYLNKKLRMTGNLLAFDQTLDRMYPNNKEAIDKYLQQIYPVFVYLMLEFSRKNDILVTFYLYILRKYKVLYQKPIGPIHDVVRALIKEPSIYCRENALRALYTCGDAESTIQALLSIEEIGYYHSGKLITDGLLSFAGDHGKLGEMIWQYLPHFTRDMQVVLLNYLRFQSGDHKDKMLALLVDPEQDDEIRFSCIRYFGKYTDERAYPELLKLADIRTAPRWEYPAIASTALASYPCEETAEALKRNLHSESWYVRFNSARGLDQMGFEYMDMVDIFDGEDRYAREMLLYYMDQKKEREAVRA